MFEELTQYIWKQFHGAPADDDYRFSLGGFQDSALFLRNFSEKNLYVHWNDLISSVVFHVDSCSENSSGGSDRHAPEIRWGKDMKLFAQSRLEAPMNTKSLLLGWRLQSKGRKRMTLCCYSVVVWIKAAWAEPDSL